jgi:MFS family permease
LQTRLTLCLNRKMSNSKRFSALSYRDFRLFWFGQIISITGTWMQSVAQGWLVYSLTKSPFYLGMVAAAASLPILLFTLPAGVLADRLPKRNLLLYTQAFSVVPALMLGILTSLKVIAVWQVALLAAMLGSINAVDIPTRQSFLAEMVERGQVANAIALNSAAFNGARIIGPMIAGAVIASMGIPACFFLNALSFGAVILALSKMQTKGEMKVKSEGMIKDFRKGIGFVRGNREIVAVITLIGVFSLAGLPYISLLPVFAGGIFHKGATGYGFLMGASGIGALTAAVGIAARRSIQNPLEMMSVAVLCFSTALLAFSLSRIFWVSLVIIMFGGWGMVSYLALANSFIQMSVPDELRGRVMSVYSFVFLGTVPIGNAIMGSVADRIGTTNAVTVGGTICIAGAVLFARKYGKKEGVTP